MMILQYYIEDWRVTQTTFSPTVSYLLSFVNVIIMFIPHTPINS